MANLVGMLNRFIGGSGRRSGAAGGASRRGHGTSGQDEAIGRGVRGLFRRFRR